MSQRTLPRSIPVPESVETGCATLPGYCLPQVGSGGEACSGPPDFNRWNNFSLYSPWDLPKFNIAVKFIGAIVNG
jgi:hypothetical protein